MAAAFFNRYAEEGCRAISAGTEPAANVHLEVVEAMREIGIELSHTRPQKLTEQLARNAEYLVTMGCGDKCPFVPGLCVIDWSIPDPKGQTSERVREIRDQIERAVKNLLSADCPDCFVPESQAERVSGRI